MGLQRRFQGLINEYLTDLGWAARVGQWFEDLDVDVLVGIDLDFDLVVDASNNLGARRGTN
jgi:hypothetical protein